MRLLIRVVCVYFWRNVNWVPNTSRPAGECDPPTMVCFAKIEIAFISTAISLLKKEEYTTMNILVNPAPGLGRPRSFVETGRGRAVKNNTAMHVKVSDLSVTAEGVNTAV